jgi:uncharacterized PurR-regulated membrane protein YhhQ (DUF165 family)
MNRRTVGVAAIVGYLATVILANYLTTQYGLIPVGFGLVTTAGTYAAGFAYVFRDTVQDFTGRPQRFPWGVLAVILAGGALSFAVAAPRIALASAVAFTLSELADWAVYTPLRSGGYVRAALASNIVGAVVDTVLFLWVAGFPVWAALPGQLLAKFTVTALVVALVVITRAVHGHALNTRDT